MQTGERFGNLNFYWQALKLFALITLWKIYPTLLPDTWADASQHMQSCIKKKKSASLQTPNVRIGGAVFLITQHISYPKYDHSWEEKKESDAPFTKIYCDAFLNKSLGVDSETQALAKQINLTHRTDRQVAECVTHGITTQTQLSNYITVN